MPIIQRNQMQQKLKDLFAYWEKRRLGRDMPTLATIDPPGLKPWLDNLIIIQVKKEEVTYRYYGASFVEAFGVDMEGLGLEILPKAQRTLLQQEYDYVRERKKPTWRLYSGDFDGEIVTWERLILPVSARDNEVDTILVAAYEVRNEGIFDVF